MVAAGVVKSAGRVLRVFELFALERTPLAAAEITRRLNWPKSSTNMLLHSLVTLGYLTLEKRSLEYFPSGKLASLSDWIPDALLVGEQGIIERLDELHVRTGETVTLSMQNGFDIQFVIVRPGTFPIALMIREGDVAPIFTTAVGMAFLASQPEDAVRRLVQRANHRREPVRRVEINKVMGEVKTAKQRGFAAAYERISPDTGAIAVPLRTRNAARTLVVGVGGLANRIRRSESQLFEAIHKSFGKGYIAIHPATAG